MPPPHPMRPRTHIASSASARMLRRATSRRLTTGSLRSSIRTRTRTRLRKTNSQRHRQRTRYFQTLRRKRRTTCTALLRLTKEVDSIPLALRVVVQGQELEIRSVEALLALAVRAGSVRNSTSKIFLAHLLEA